MVLFGRQLLRTHAQRSRSVGPTTGGTRSDERVVAGAGGFIGHHMVKYLKADGYWVRGVDIKQPDYEATAADEFEDLDLRDPENCLKATRGVEEVYQLAADMGGIGYITAFHADVARNNVLINAHMLEAAHNRRARYFFSSSACIYPMYRQRAPDVDAAEGGGRLPGRPGEGYGWEKLYAEKLCQYYDEEGKLRTRVARFHNIYGPLGTYEGGREKAPAAICRKVALARTATRSRSGATASRPARSPTSMTASRVSTASSARTIGAAQPRLGRLISVDGLVDLVSGSPASSSPSGTTSGSRRACAAATATTPGSGRSSAGSRDVARGRARANTYRWSRAELAKGGRLPDRTRRRERDDGMSQRADETCVAGPDHGAAALGRLPSCGTSEVSELPVRSLPDDRSGSLDTTARAAWMI